MSYDAPRNTATNAITICVIALFGCIPILATLLNDRAPLFIVMPLLAGLLIVTWLFAPKKYEITPSELFVRRPGGDVRIPLRDIRGARLLQKDDLRGLLRTFGNGGLFGFYGRYWNRRLGTQRWYASRNSELVAIQTSTRLLVLSPEHPADFVNEINSKR
jgi:hypothetical protein